jgi:hypothetical protein
MSRPRLEVHVERLVLHGLDPGDQAALGPAVERALAAALAGQGLAPELAAGPERGALDAGAVELGRRPLADDLAQAVAGALSRGGPR